MADLLLITPPFTQLNTPYPATAYLKGFFNEQKIEVEQQDLGIEVILKLFSKEGLQAAFSQAQKCPDPSDNLLKILALEKRYISVIEPVIRFLQGKNPSLARQICAGQYLPEASRFAQLEEMDWAFGTMGIQDHAKHLATLFLEDLSDMIVEAVDPHFGFSRYAERLGRSANSFAELQIHIEGRETFVDQFTLHLLEEKIIATKPKIIGFSVPFPGNLYSAFRCAKYLKELYPQITTVMGGGFPNTELRDLTETAVFNYFDYITLDDGERPFLLLYNFITKGGQDDYFRRTLCLRNDQVTYINNATESDFKQNQLGTPDYSGLPLEDYISVIEIANPMHSLWSDGRWNKLTMAHGCYWGKCTFCDISLDYIKLYEPIAAKTLVDRMEKLMEETQNSGFHFVDEAAPPALMKEVALEILRRDLSVTWWTNIRFEKSFSQDLCYLLKASGCIAVSGGLEVASGRLLKLIDKGVTVEQVAQVTSHFTKAGIMVHAYLMYGYPTQTIQETLDSLEMVKQLFELGVIQSGFWHQFALTAHSPVGQDPAYFGVIPHRKEISFANNDIDFTDSTGIDHSIFSYGLRKSLYNFMHGLGFERPVNKWFDDSMPRTTVNKDYILNCIESEQIFSLQESSTILWIGSKPQVLAEKKGKIRVRIHSLNSFQDVSMPINEGLWVLQLLPKLTIQNKKTRVAEVKSEFEKEFDSFELFWFSKPILTLRACGLLVV